MATPSLGVDINFKTSADTRSLEDLNKDLKEMEAELRRLKVSDAGWSEQALKVQTLKTRLKELNDQTKALPSAQDKVARSSANMGQAMLQGSRGLQDFQAAGMMGIANNLEGIATAMGLGAGVAGVVTVLGVAIQTVGPKVVEWFKGLDSEGKKLDELKERIGGAADAILSGYSSNAENATRISKAFSDELEREAKALKASSDEMRLQNDLLKQRNSVQDSADKQKEAADIDTINSRTDLSDSEKANAIAMVQRERATTAKQRADQQAAADMGAAVTDTEQKAKARDEAAARVAALEKEQRQNVNYGALQERIAGTKEKKDGDRVIPARKGQEQIVQDAKNRADALLTGQAKDDADAEYEREKAKLEAMKREGREMLEAMPNKGARRPEVIKDDLNKAKQTEEGLKTDTQSSADALRRKDAEERVAKVQRDNDYRREMESIEAARVKAGGDKLPMVPGAPLLPPLPAAGDPTRDLPLPLQNMPPKPQPGAPGRREAQAAEKEGVGAVEEFKTLAETMGSTFEELVKIAKEMQKASEETKRRLRAMV